MRIFLEQDAPCDKRWLPVDIRQATQKKDTHPVGGGVFLCENIYPDDADLGHPPTETEAHPPGMEVRVLVDRALRGVCWEWTVCKQEEIECMVTFEPKYLRAIRCVRGGE